MRSAYIHIPFCSNICSYCDFCKLIYQKKWIKPYLESLGKEIELKYHNEELDTIYIGGGTPSSLDVLELQILFKIINRLNKSKNIELTFECNIEDLNEEKIKILKLNGVNRISIGVQSFISKNIKLLNRTHNKKIVIDKINLLKANGFDNINIDLIYAIPGESLEDLEYDLDCFLELDLTHISTYSLIIEENTNLFIKNIKNIDEDLDYQMYELIKKKLGHYHHYEISNFCKKGYESKHNLTYWNNQTYYGFGLGAVGYDGKTRYTNTRNLNKYLKGNYLFEQEDISFNQRIENALILGFRKIDGINVDDFEKEYKINIKKITCMQQLIDEKKLITEENYIKISEDYVYTSNEILINFIGVDYEEV